MQAEVDAPREHVFPLVATADGLSRWVDEVELEERVGGAVRLRLADAVAAGSVVALDPPQHISFTFDWENAPLGARTVVAFDAIEHGHGTHVTLRHVGLRSRRQLEQHAELWRYWFERLLEAANTAR